MMTKLIAASTVFVCLCGFAARMSAQSPASGVSGGDSPESKDAYTPAEALNPVALTVPTISVVVDPTLQLDQNTQNLYQQMASILDGSSFVPADRRNYYSAYVNSNTETIHGWSSWLQNVAPNCNGYIVTITVIPTMSSSNAGGCTILDGSSYFEQYEVTNGQAQYVGFIDPNGTAGQQFPMIGL